MSSGGVVCRGKEVLSCFLRHFLSGPPSIHIPHPWLSSCGEVLGGCGVGVGALGVLVLRAAGDSPW